MKNPKIYSYLGLAMRAGKLAAGEENVLNAVRSQQAKLVIVAADASHNALKKYRDKCGFFNIPMMVFSSREALGASIGKAERVAIAVNDSGFAEMIRKCQVKPAEVE